MAAPGVHQNYPKIILQWHGVARHAKIVKKTMIINATEDIEGTCRQEIALEKITYGMLMHAVAFDEWVCVVLNMLER